jgi:FAD/FMN-containing dehydrogenase
LSDGSEVVLKDLSSEGVDKKQRTGGLEGQVYREVSRLAKDNRSEILLRYPKIMRRVSGYNLDEFIKSQPFNLSRILTGSEGTLATIVEAKMRLVPKPKWTAMDVIHFYSDQEALECAQLILQKTR